MRLTVRIMLNARLGVVTSPASFAYLEVNCVSGCSLTPCSLSKQWLHDSAALSMSARIQASPLLSLSSSTLSASDQQC
jgi:hypothetical protein